MGLEIKTSAWQLLSFKTSFIIVNCTLKGNQCSRRKMIYLQFSWWNHWSSLTIHYDHISKVYKKIMRYFFHLLLLKNDSIGRWSNFLNQNGKNEKFDFMDFYPTFYWYGRQKCLVIFDDNLEILAIVSSSKRPSFAVAAISKSAKNIKIRSVKGSVKDLLWYGRNTLFLMCITLWYF